MSKIIIIKMWLKISHLRLQPPLPGAYELNKSPIFTGFHKNTASFIIYNITFEYNKLHFIMYSEMYTLYENFTDILLYIP